MSRYEWKRAPLLPGNPWGFVSNADEYEVVISQASYDKCNTPQGPQRAFTTGFTAAPLSDHYVSVQLCPGKFAAL